MKDLHLYSRDYYAYIRMLCGGERYHIMISKRLLLRPLIPLWALLFLLFCVRSWVFFGIAVLPVLILYSVHALRMYGIWYACGVSERRYVLFHVLALVFMKIAALGASEVFISLFGWQLGIM